VQKGGPQFLQALHLSRARQRHTIVRVVDICSAAVSACGRGQSRHLNLHIVRAMRRYAIVLDVDTFSAAIGACARDQPLQPASHLVRAIRRHVIEPEVFTYCAALRVCDKRQSHQLALHLSRAMQRHAIVPVVVFYRATAKGVPSRRMWSSTVCHQQALPLLRAMRRQAVVPDVATYRAAVLVFDQCQQPQQALHLWRAIQQALLLWRAMALSGERYSRPYISYGRWATVAEGENIAGVLRSARSSCRAALSVCEGPSAPAGLTPLSCDAVLCHRAVRGHLRCRPQRVR